MRARALPVGDNAVSRVRLMKLENISLKFELMLYIFILQNRWFAKYEKLLQCKKKKNQQKNHLIIS